MEFFIPTSHKPEARHWLIFDCILLDIFPHLNIQNVKITHLHILWKNCLITFSHGLKYWNCGLSLCHRPFELSSMTGLPFQTKLFWIQTGRGRTNRELLERVDKECKSAEKSFQLASRASLYPLFRDRTLQREICVDGNSAHSQSFWSQSPETPT